MKTLLLALLLTIPVGCVHVRNGIHNALSDSLDILRADLSFSFGTDMGAHVMVTKFLQLKSYSYEDLYRAGFGTRSAGIWGEERQDWWIGPWHARNLHARRQDVASVSAMLPAKMRSGREAAFQLVAESTDEVGVGLHLFLVGARAGVRPFELLDFLANFVGLDPCGDNLSIREREAMRAAEKAAKEAAEKAAEDPAPQADAAGRAALLRRQGRDGCLVDGGREGGAPAPPGS